MVSFNEFLTYLEFDFIEANKGKRFRVFSKWFLENDPEGFETAEHEPVIDWCGLETAPHQQQQYTVPQ